MKTLLKLLLAFGVVLAASMYIEQLDSIASSGVMLANAIPFIHFNRGSNCGMAGVSDIIYADKDDFTAMPSLPPLQEELNDVVVMEGVFTPKPNKGFYRAGEDEDSAKADFEMVGNRRSQHFMQKGTWRHAKLTPEATALLSVLRCKNAIVGFRQADEQGLTYAFIGFGRPISLLGSSGTTGQGSEDDKGVTYNIESKHVHAGLLFYTFPADTGVPYAPLS